MITISPGRTSPRYLAPMMSKAGVSEATTYAPPREAGRRPSTRGRTPLGSRTAYSACRVSMTME